MEWLICLSIVNLMLGCLLFKNLKNLMNLVHCQKQLECHQRILNKRFVKIIFIKPLRFVNTYGNISKDRIQRRTHGYSINLIIKFTFKKKWVCDLAKRKSFLSSLSDTHMLLFSANFSA